MQRRSYSILIVDDSTLNIAVLTEALKGGYNLLVSRSGEDALDIVLNEGPDLILLDVMMPKMNGFDVCRQIKANPLTRSIPIIFLSGRDDVKSKTEGFQCGGVDYITKPFEVLEVTARVELHLELMRTRRALERHNQDLEGRVQERTHQVREIQRARYESLNNLADAVAHQVRNPVVAIGGMAKLMMRKHPEGSRDREYLLSILDEALRLENMVRSVTDFTALTVQRKERIDVVHAVQKAREQALAATQNLLAEHDVQWELDVQPHPLLGNVDVLSRGIRELFINSLEAFALKKEKQGRVLVAGGNKGRFYQIEITDNGPGISPDNLPFVTDPFFTTKSVGVGMGLAMAARVAEEHDGVLRIESSENGTRALLELPA